MIHYSTDPRPNAFLCSQIYFSTNSFNTDSGKPFAVWSERWIYAWANEIRLLLNWSCRKSKIGELSAVISLSFLPIKTRTNKSIEEVIQNAGAINDNSTCAANTTATGLGITTANPGRKVTFTITSRDSQNFQRKLGGDVFEVKLKPEVGGDEIKVELNDREDGTYLAEYTVDKLYGKLTLSVCLRGAHIKGSPFAVLVEPLNPFAVLQEPPGLFAVLEKTPKQLSVLQEPPGPFAVLEEPPRPNPKTSTKKLYAESLSTGYDRKGTRRLLTPRPKPKYTTACVSIPSGNDVTGTSGLPKKIDAQPRKFR